MTFQLGDLVADPRVPMTRAPQDRPVSRSERESLAYDLRTVERFDVTAAYAWHQTALTREAQSLAKFPPLRMPFPRLWVEAASHLVPATRFGALVQDVSNKDMPELLDEILKENPFTRFGDRMLLLYLVESNSAGVVVSPHFHVIHVTESGEYVYYDVSTGGAEKRPGMTIERVKHAAEVEQEFIVRPLLFGMSLSNVKNARMSEPRLLGNPHTKKGRRRPPRNRYRVISIPGSPADDRPSRGGHRDVAKHLVRGHFKTWANYFGRGPATYWVPFHSRGKREQGVVDKDYQVEPPTD